MADDYAPIYKPGDSPVLTASADITSGGLLVEITGINTVAMTGAASQKVAGVAMFGVKSGQPLTVSTEGVHELIASGAIAAGDLVMSAAAGKASTLTGTNYAQVVGRALTSAADGAKVQVLFP